MLTVAALLTLTSGVLSGVAHSIQRRSLDKVPELTPRAFIQRHMYLVFRLFTTPLWLLGGGLALLGALLRWQAFSAADVSLLKPLTNINILVVVALCAGLWKERIGRAEWVGIASLLAGVVALSLFSEERTLLAYNLPWYLVSTVASLILVGTLAAVGSAPGCSDKDKELLFALSAGVLYGIATIFLKAMTIEVLQQLGYFHVPDLLCLLVLAGRPSFWLYVSSSTIAFFLLQCAYSHRRASVALPVNNSLSTLVPVLVASLVFSDPLLILVGGQILFPYSFMRLIGVATILVGIALLRRFQEPLLSGVSS